MQVVSDSPGNIGHRLENVKDMYKQPRSECKAVFSAIGIGNSARLSVNVLILDYRGYGDSEAKISISKSYWGWSRLCQCEKDGSGPSEHGFLQVGRFTGLLNARRATLDRAAEVCIAEDAEAAYRWLVQRARKSGGA